MISFTFACERAMERAAVILWRPAQMERWMKLGFAAFLALMATGGVSVNIPRFNFSQPKPPVSGDLHSVFHFYKEILANMFDVTSTLGLLYTLVSLVVPILSMFVFVWIGSRGQFVFLDNIVRNRTALREPWHRYAGAGTSWFLFYVCVQIFNFLFLAMLGGLAAVVAWSSLRDEVMPTSAQLGLLIVLGLVYGLYVIIAAPVYIVLRDFGVPLMFLRGISALGAIRETFRLCLRDPAGIFAYVMIRILSASLFVVLVVMVFCLFCCFTVCLTAIPFVGNIILFAIFAQVFLPFLVFIRCFTLDCLAQFGPEYDVWAVDVMPAPTAPLPSLQPPPG